MRLCANTGTQLHLIHPLGFQLDHAKMRRAGLDYADWSRIMQHPNWSSCQSYFTVHQPAARYYAFSSKASKWYSDVPFTGTPVFLFGPETRGLPASVLADIPESQQLRIPMQPHSRSLNLSNSVAVALYEALRQQAFTGLQ